MSAPRHQLPWRKKVQSQHRKGRPKCDKATHIPAAHSLLGLGEDQGASGVTGTATVLLALSFRDLPNGERGAGDTD